ncbi:hypothetical protein [Pseudomonas phage Njord]|uniref:Uncharacterized protein n=1 Tax=Pseudomonas phage Njord TaxID=2163985 RepID=A0A2S1GMM3_9CAUD|nr:hypothetical protein HOT08_gp42 [Pseudomonas phage Njord]AWD90630.1 hypothetical protein [Pseudomonas phage Njord]
MFSAPAFCAMSESTDTIGRFALLEFIAINLTAAGVAPGATVWHWPEATTPTTQWIPQGGSDPLRSTSGNAVIFSAGKNLVMSNVPAWCADPFGIYLNMRLDQQLANDSSMVIHRCLHTATPFETLKIELVRNADTLQATRLRLTATQATGVQVQLYHPMTFPVGTFFNVYAEFDGTNMSLTIGLNEVTVACGPLMLNDNIMSLGYNGVNGDNDFIGRLREITRYAGTRTL